MKKIMTVLVAGVIALVATSASADTIKIKGSDTLINLVQRLAEVYMQQNPGKSISVTGGGSGTGIAALINQKCDIANASRGIKSKEVANANDNGVEPIRVVVAMDGLSVIVNKNNPISQLTMDQIGMLFRGEGDWGDVGGAGSVTLYGRQSNSGTFGFFREFVLKGEYSASMNRMNGNSQIVEAVKADPSGIGYVGVGYVKNDSNIKVLKVAANKNAVYASPLVEADVKSGAYPIARPLNQYLNGKPTGAVKDFIAFELSPAGQAIVAEEGFFKLPGEYEQYNAVAGM